MNSLVTQPSPPPFPHGPATATDPSQLAGSLLRDLNHPVPDAPDAGILWTLILAVPTLGFLPALLWPLRLNAAIATERRQYLDLARWLRGQVRDARAVDRLEGAAMRVRAQPMLAMLSACFALAVGAMFITAWPGPTRGTSFLLDCTYRFPALSLLQHPPSRLMFGAVLRRSLFVAWAFGLSFCFTLQWLQVHLHAANVRRFLEQFNRVIVHEGLAPVFLPPVAGLRPLWTIASVPLLCYGALWGLPLMLAGGLQRRYMRRASRAARAGLAARVRDLLVLHRPVPAPYAETAAPNARLSRCATPVCCQVLPAGARFCPRCGARVMPPVDRFA